MALASVPAKGKPTLELRTRPARLVRARVGAGSMSNQNCYKISTACVVMAADICSRRDIPSGCSCLRIISIGVRSWPTCALTSCAGWQGKVVQCVGGRRAHFHSTSSSCRSSRLGSRRPRLAHGRVCSRSKAFNSAFRSTPHECGLGMPKRISPNPSRGEHVACHRLSRALLRWRSTRARSSACCSGVHERKPSPLFMPSLPCATSFSRYGDGPGRASSAGSTV